MNSNTDPKVSEFISNLEISDYEKFTLLSHLRNLVFQVFPRINERMMYGGIMLSLGSDVGGLFVYKNHISFEFGNGAEFEDPDQLLEGKGKFRRHLKYRSEKDISEKRTIFFIKQMGS